MIIFRYLARQVFVSMFSVTLILLLVFMSGRFIRYLERVAAGRLSADILFPVMAFRLPEFLQLILPLGFYIGILLAYGRMYLESEMTVLHSCGMSKNKLLRTSLSLSAIVAIFIGTISLYLTPWGFLQAKTLLTENSKLSAFELISPGRFQSQPSEGRVIYVGNMSKDKKNLYDVYVSEPSSQVQIYAESGLMDINETNGEKFLVLSNGTRYTGTPGEYDFQVTEFQKLGVKFENHSANEATTYKITSIPTSELIGANDLASIAELQWRISLPFLAPIVCLLAVSFSQVNPRQGRFLHLFPAMLIYVTYIALLTTARKKVEKGDLSPTLGLWSVHIIFLLLAIILLNRDKIPTLIRFNLPKLKPWS